MSKNAFISFYAKSKIIDFVRVTNEMNQYGMALFGTFHKLRAES